jgi:hypothetical protein
MTEHEFRELIKYEYDRLTAHRRGFFTAEEAVQHNLPKETRFFHPDVIIFEYAPRLVTLQFTGEPGDTVRSKLHSEHAQGGPIAYLPMYLPYLYIVAYAYLATRHQVTECTDVLDYRPNSVYTSRRPLSREDFSEEVIELNVPGFSHSGSFGDMCMGAGCQEHFRPIAKAAEYALRDFLFTQFNLDRCRPAIIRNIKDTLKWLKDRSRRPPILRLNKSYLFKTGRFGRNSFNLRHFEDLISGRASTDADHLEKE